MMQRITKSLRYGAALCLVSGSFFSGCSTTPPGHVQPETRYISVERPAKVPPGVLRYCWEEPIVAYQQQGPGLDIEGRWYSPSYVAVKEVRQGRWRPCQPLASEVKGETKNER